MAQVRQTERESETSRKSATSDRAALSLLDNAKSLAPLFMANSVANEQNGALSDEVIEALHDGGLFGLFVPKCLGGFEAGPVDALAVIEAVSYADASTGWVMFAVGVANGSGAAYLHDDAIARIFRGDRFPVIAGQGIPNGKATAVKNGFQLSGNWSYGSGLKHAAYIHTGAIVFDNGAPRLDKAGNPEGRICVVPREQATLGDNWDVIGLRATGSIDYSINNVFVPEEYTHINHETRPLRGGALYSIGIIGLATLGHAAFALGVGRRALDEIAAVARAKSGPTGTLRESETFHIGYAKAEAGYRAARALVYETWRDIEESLDRGDPASTRQLSLARLALNNATWTVADVCQFAYRAGGGIALRQGVIQRYFRDMQAATQHVTSSTPVLRECGRELAGFAKGQVWGFIGLIDAH